MPLLLAALSLLLLLPSPVWALQPHAAPEGLYVHQGAHLLLVAAMAGFAIRLRRAGLTREPAWHLFALGAWLFLLWNLWAFSGHLFTLLIADDAILALEGKQAPLLLVGSWREVVYYLLKLDHLLSLPALILFYAGLRRMERQATGAETEESP